MKIPKLPKCPNTVTGKHIMRSMTTEYWDSGVQKRFTEYEFSMGKVLEKCIACGLVDDRVGKI